MMKRMLKLLFLFIALFILNISVFWVLSILGFPIVMSEMSYILPPFVSMLTLVGLEKLYRRNR